MIFPLLDRRQRKVGRFLLYGSLVAVILGLLVGAQVLQRQARLEPDQSWLDTDFSALPEVQLLREYIRIDTTADKGSELAGARFLAEHLEAAGIPAHIEQLGQDKANLWAILEGESREALVLHSHIDVYPINNPENWDYPPFGAEIDLPHLYGRGAFDMKSVAIAQLMAFLDLHRSEIRPRRSVIFLATGSEEVGSELGTRWILQQHPELSDRFWAVLTEGGVVEPVSTEQIKYWGIEFAQKQFSGGEICSASRGPLEEVRDLILQVGDLQLEIVLTPEVLTFLSAYAESRDRTLDELLPAHTFARRDLYRELPSYIQALFRDELVPFPIEEAPGGGYRLPLVFHLLPGSDVEAVKKRLLPSWITHGLTVVLEPAMGASHGSSTQHPVFRSLVEAIRDEQPETTVGPYFVPWSATDARFFRLAGVPSYGFSPFLVFNTDTFRVDASNERIGLPGYVAGVELYRRVLTKILD